MQAALLAPLAAAGFLALAGRGELSLGPYAALFVGVAVAATVATHLPWDRLVRAPWGMRALYAWSAVTVVLVTLGIRAAGGARSHLVLLYGLTAVFFAILFPPRAQALLLAFISACYVALLGVTGWDTFFLAVLAILSVLTSFLSRELKLQMAAHREALAESELRWVLVAKVSAAARSMSTVEYSDVLQAVVDSVVALGFDAAHIRLCREGEQDDRVVLPTGGSEHALHGIPSLPAAIRDAVLKGGTTIVAEDHGHDPEARPLLEATGLETVVAAPIPVEGTTEAILVAGTSARPGPSPQDLEVLGMMAAQATLALENARRFEAQRQAVEHMSELNQLKSDFLSTVSHELRTPLTVVLGIGQTLDGTWDALDDEVRRDLLSRLNANATSLDRIIGQLLDFSRLEVGQLRANVGETALEPLVHAVADRLQTLFRGHQLSMDVEEGLVVEADSLLIERVIENLLSNAAKYTPKGSHVTLSAYPEGGHAVVAVSDDGPGIPEEDLRHLGERFFRGGDPNTRGTRGTGLGLALVSEILMLHGSELEIESKPGAGSRFAFTLPLVGYQRAEGGLEGAWADRLPSGLSSKDEASEPSSPPGSASATSTKRTFQSVLAAARTGAEWAVRSLYRDLNLKIVRYLEALAPAEAEQLALHVWQEVASGLHAFEGDEAEFRMWVFTLARRALERGRRGDGTHADPLSIGQAGQHPIERETASPSTDAAFQSITRLPSDQAEIVLLRALGSFGPEEVAAIIGKRPATVRLLELEALERLRSEWPVTSSEMSPQQHG